MNAQSTTTSSGSEERRLARGSISQQASQVVGTVATFVVITAVARRWTITAFGVYGLLISMTAYLVIIQSSVAGGSMRTIAAAQDRDERQRAFSVALGLYAVTGVLSGLVLAFVGTAVLGILNVPPRFDQQATISLIGLGVALAIGWPLQTYQDVLRASKHFTQAAAAEIVAFVIYGAGALLLIYLRASLWTIVVITGSVPALTGACGLIAVKARNLDYRFHRSFVTREAVTSFLHFSSFLLILGVTDFVIYSLDRAILSAFRSPRAVGLYEGPIRAHNLVRQLSGTLIVTVLPTAAMYIAQGDEPRTRELLLRGTRYSVAVLVPITVVLVTLSRPILHVWLGARYDVAASALAIVVSYWLVASSTTVPVAMLLAAGRARVVTQWALALAALNLVLSVLLTRTLGLNGVMLGTAIPAYLLYPVLVFVACKAFPVTLGDFAREVWRPAFSLAIPLAIALVAVRTTLRPATLAAVVAVAVSALGIYWACYAGFFLHPGERRLLRDLLRRT